MWEVCNMSSIPNIKLNESNSIPVIGLGTWKSLPGEVKTAVERAIDCGYRHIDCAASYENKKEVGEAIRFKINEGVVTREELFITSKLWCSNHAPVDVKPAIEESLKNLQLNYLDLYLIHAPIGVKHGPDLLPRYDEGKVILTDDDYLDTWKAMEELQIVGLTRSIGVSNFNEYQIERIIKNCSIPPSNSQVESHPYFLNEGHLNFCKNHNISFTAYSPFGSPDRPWVTPNDPKLLDDPRIVEVANKLGKTPGQVAIRFQIQRGVIVIPKSVTPSRISSNFDVFGFELSEENMKIIGGCERNGRVCRIPWAVGHKYHPFKENYAE